MVDVMFDSDEPAVLLLPALAGCRVATYADLLTPSLVKQFGPRLVAIDRGLGDPLGLATVVDIESGAWDVAAGVARVKQFLAEHRPGPMAYHDRNDWTAVAAGLAGTSARHWVATLDGTSSPDGKQPAAVQILGAAAVGFHADLSIVWDTTWHPIDNQVPTAELVKLKGLALAAQGPAAALGAYIASL